MSPKTLAGFAAVVAAIVFLTAIFGIKFLIGVIALIIVLYMISVSVFGDNRHPDEVHYAPTDDGWDIGIWRVKPKAGPAKPIPIIFQHGLGANQRNGDLDDRCSMAHYFASRGYDCYLPALRGCGPSVYRKDTRDKWNITFEQFVEKDQPAVFAKIKELTGAEKVHFIGMSMGAMVGYALAEGEIGKKMQSFTAVCGPCFFEHMQQFRSILPFRRYMRSLSVIHMKFFARVQAPLLRFFPRLAGNDEVNWVNVDGETLARASVNLIENLPTTLLDQFGQWVEDKEFGSHLGEGSYEKNLHKITAPIYCLGGNEDRFCAPAANDKVVERVSSAKKRYRLFSKANGGLADYGHGDIAVGRTAPEEVFPTILEWVAENEG